ncbi:MAG: hypothetical protein FD135_577 [Comamonadaceae bacterium]|nr:MAG: hypothetical protein FD135_577 [Comamonadaceae bacterium]
MAYAQTALELVATKHIPLRGFHQRRVTSFPGVLENLLQLRVNLAHVHIHRPARLGKALQNGKTLLLMNVCVFSFAMLLMKVVHLEVKHRHIARRMSRLKWASAKSNGMRAVACSLATAKSNLAPNDAHFTQIQAYNSLVTPIKYAQAATIFIVKLKKKKKMANPPAELAMESAIQRSCVPFSTDKFLPRHWRRVWVRSTQVQTTQHMRTLVVGTVNLRFPDPVQATA